MEQADRTADGRLGRLTFAAPAYAWGGGGGTLLVMPMRQDCKNFESRTYANGETVRKCNLDLAPDAPWRCPDSCHKYEKRLADVNWKHGTLVTPPTPPEPPGLDEPDERVARLLDEAEDIVNSVGPQMLAEVRAEQARDAARNPFWKRLFRRR